MNVLETYVINLHIPCVQKCLDIFDVGFIKMSTRIKHEKT